MLEQSKEEQTAQKTQKSEDVVRQSAEEFLKERIGEKNMEKLKKVRIPDQSFANHKHTSMLFSPF